MGHVARRAGWLALLHRRRLWGAAYDHGRWAVAGRPRRSQASNAHPCRVARRGAAQVERMAAGRGVQLLVHAAATATWGSAAVPAVSADGLEMQWAVNHLARSPSASLPFHSPQRGGPGLS